jgi:hypothetical protein
MGRHAEHGEDALPSRGKRAPKAAPESVDHDEPIGRRLRPEESAVTEVGTGFLGSGWSAESEPSEPVQTEKRLPGGRKMMLLAVAAMVVVLGGTVVGVQAMTGPVGSSTDCPLGGCVLAASNPPVPQQAEATGPDGEPTSGEESGGEEPGEGTAGGTAEPAPTPTATRRSAAAASEPSPTRAPKATRAPRPTVDEPLPADADSPADGPEPADRTESDRPEPTDRPARADAPEPSRSPTSAPPADGGAHAPAQPPATTPTQAPEATTPAVAKAISVDVDLVREQARSSYTVKVVVAADERLDGVQLSLPVSGRVSSVSGAGWKQDGETLMIESHKDLEAGEKLVISFTARGPAEVPQTCESSQGECAIA